MSPAGGFAARLDPVRSRLVKYRYAQGIDAVGAYLADAPRPLQGMDNVTTHILKISFRVLGHCFE